MGHDNKRGWMVPMSQQLRLITQEPWIFSFYGLSTTSSSSPTSWKQAKPVVVIHKDFGLLFGIALDPPITTPNEQLVGRGKQIHLSPLVNTPGRPSVGAGLYSSRHE